VPGNWQARFWRPVERGDPSAEFNGETHRGQQLPQGLPLAQVSYGLSLLLLDLNPRFKGIYASLDYSSEPPTLRTSSHPPVMCNYW